MTYTPNHLTRRLVRPDRATPEHHYNAPALSRVHENWRPATLDEIENLRALYKRLRFDEASRSPFEVVRDWNYFKWPISTLIRQLENYEKKLIERGSSVGV